MSINKKLKSISRRKFIGQASCLGIGYTTLFSSLINLKALNAAAMSNSLVAEGNDYKALVCFMQSGGNDSFNMLMPYNSDEYNDYANTRSNLAIPKEELLTISPSNTPGREFGLHPSASALQTLFNDGALSFVSNIGTLTEPVNKTQIFNQSANLPLGLFSHADQSQQWQTAHTHTRSNKGWGGRIADLIQDMNNNENISMNISLAGRNIFQTGNQVSELTLDPNNGASGILGFGEDSYSGIFENQTQAINKMLDKQYADVFKQTYVDVIKVSRDAYIEIQNALENTAGLNTIFSDNQLSKSFEMVARMIKARDNLGFKRQVFFVEMGGWDHHDELLYNHGQMMATVSQALSEFYQALNEIDMLDNVTTFSLSEFGRTLTSNGNGTDHAWAGNVMLMGGEQLNGGRIYGNYPSLNLSNDQMLWDGILIPQLSADMYFAELAKWFDVPATELINIFPNLGNFYNVNSGDLPIGFINM